MRNFFKINFITLILFIWFNFACKNGTEYHNQQNKNNPFEGNWLFSYAELCSKDDLLFGDAFYFHYVEISNSTDSILLFNNLLNTFYLGDKSEKLNLFGPNRVYPHSKEILVITQKIPRTKNGQCDSLTYYQLKKQNFLIHERKAVTKSDTLLYLTNNREDSLKNKILHIPKDFVIQKSGDYKLYPYGVEPIEFAPPNKTTNN